MKRYLFKRPRKGPEVLTPRIEEQFAALESDSERDRERERERERELLGSFHRGFQKGGSTLALRRNRLPGNVEGARRGKRGKRGKSGKRKSERERF